MVEHHVENDLDARLMQRLHHALEFGHGVVHGILVGRCEPADRIVAPIILQAPIEHKRLAHEGLAGQQFDRGDADRFQVLDDRRRREPQILPAPLLGDRRMQAGKAFHVQFIDHGVAPRRRRRPVALPAEGRIDHPRAQRRSGRELACRRIDQNGRGIEAVTILRLIRSLRAKGVEGSGTCAARRQQPVPNIVGASRQFVARRLGAALRIEQAQFHARRMAGEDREIDAGLGQRGAQGFRGTRLN